MQQTDCVIRNHWSQVTYTAVDDERSCFVDVGFV